MSEKTYLCNACGRWKLDGAYVPSEGPASSKIWVGKECLTEEEIKDWYISVRFGTCRYCHRTIELAGDIWVDPEATGDDSIWRETCESHDTFQADHEPEEA